MSRGYWYSIIAVVGWLALTGWAEGHDGDEPNHHKQHTATSQSTDPTQQPSPLQNAPNTVTVKTPCDSPIAKYESDLCQQWRMAEATDNIVKVSWGQLVLTGFSLLGLGITIWYTRHSNQIAREIGEAQTRAYVGTLSGVISWENNGTVFRFHHFFTNTGQSPALNFTMSMKFAVWDLPDLTGAFPEIIVTKSQPSKGQLAVGAKVGAPVLTPATQTDIDNILAPSPTRGLFVWGIVNYTDVFRKPHWMKFKFQIYYTSNEGWMWAPTPDNNASDEGDP
jgi:hypothetical protein